MTVSVPTTTTYNVWVRMNSPDSANNSVLLQLDQGDCFTVGGDPSAVTGNFVWVGYQQGKEADVMQTSLSAGKHTLKLIGVDRGVQIANVLLLANASCTPQHDGSNCTDIQPVPTSPTLSATTPKSTSVVLNWTKSMDSGGAHVAGYYVYRSSTKIAQISDPNTLTYTDTIKPGSTNTYTVVAYDDSNPPLSSAPSNATTIGTGLQPPVNLNAQAISTKQVNLTWQLSHGGAAPAGYYILQDGAIITSVGSTVTSYSDKSVSPNSGYTYALEAFDNNVPANVSAPSDAVKVRTPPSGSAPQPPTNLVAVATSSYSVKLTWSASTDPNGPGIAGYFIIREGTTIAQVTTPALTYTDTSVLPNKTYHYLVEAYDTNTPPEVSSPSNSGKLTTPPKSDSSPPTTPTNLTASAVSDSQINLNWTASTDNGGVSGYYVFSSSGNLIATVSSTSYGVTGLQAGTRYSYYVVAFDATGNKSQNSSPATATTQGAPNTITVEGKVTKAGTKASLSGVRIYTGVHGTPDGAAAANTNQAGEYVLTNILFNKSGHAYHFNYAGYKTINFQKAFPVGVNVVNETMVAK